MLLATRVRPADVRLQDGLGVDLTALFAKVQTILEKGEQYVDAAMNIIEDPALPQVVGLVRQLHSVEASKTAKTPAPATTAPKPVGIGLSRVVSPLKLYVAYRKNPVPYYFAAGGIVLAVVGIGFAAGRLSKRTKKC